MKLVEQHIIKRSNKLYKKLDELCFLSKNLYNTALYEIRQQFFKDGTFLDYYKVNRLLHDRKDINYFSLPSNTSQETLKIVHNNYKSFFGSLKLKNKVHIPKYLNSVKGRQVVVYNKMTLSKKYLCNGIIKLPKSDIEFHSKHCDDLSQVRIVPKNNHIVIEVIYNHDECELKKDNNRYMGIDIGVNNLMSCVSNVMSSFIINGKPLKSINQFYNKEKAKLQSKLKDKYISNRIKNLTIKRTNKIKDYLHKSTSYIVNQAVSNNINTIVVGKNKKWKQDINNGKVNNQNFVMIPFDMMINQLIYKARLKGINVIMQEESYTSSVSFLNNDYIPTYGVDDFNFRPTGKRVKRGMFKTKTSMLNSDINGALNILKKYLNVSSDLIIPIGSRGLVTRPVIINITNQKH